MEQLRLLLELQNCLQQKQALQKNDQLVGMAEGLRELQKTIRKAETEYLELQELVGRTEVDAQNIEQQIKKIAEQVKCSKDKLYGSKGSGLKELLSLQQSLQKSEEDVVKGEARYWEMLKAVEESTQKQKAVREVIKALKAQYNQGVREYKEEKNSIELKIAEIQCHEEAVISQLSQEDLIIFRDAVRRYPLNPIALFRGGTCMGCQISVPSLLASQVKEGKTICYCDNCGRILVQ